MDKCNSDAEFDSYWDYEAKNKNRNRIRVGRQYQATIPPLLKPGQKDGRKSEELETLKWKPDQLNDQQIEEYLSMAKGIRLFSKSLDSPPKPVEKSDNSLQSAIKGLSEFVTSHHPCHHDDGCKVPRPSSSLGESSKTSTTASDWSLSETQLFAQAVEACGKNFSAIKKEYLPWKPIKSIIEHYYEGKSENMEEEEEVNVDDDDSADLSPKKEAASPGSLKDEKICIKQEPGEGAQNTPSESEDPPKESINFLENTRVTEACRALPSEFKMAINENDDIGASATVGSLNFFLGGRLVLKLNAQQDSGSGTKCQWVQSNDIPKHSSNLKRQKKKCIPESAFPVNHSASPKVKKKADEPLPAAPSKPSAGNCDPTSVKKPKLKSEYDFSESNKQGLLLCSSSWTPPVADGQEVIEVDDASSKTSEGYVSPVLSNSRFSKADSKADFASAESDPKTTDFDPYWTRGDSKVCSNNSAENSSASDSASKSTCKNSNSPNHVNDASPFKHEMLNHHKSALPHNKLSAKNLCYQPHVGHSSSSFLKQLNKWSSVTHYMRTSSPSSLSPVTVLDLKIPPKENPLDLSSRADPDPPEGGEGSEPSPLSSTPGSLPLHGGGGCCSPGAAKEAGGSLNCSEDMPEDSEKCFEDSSSSPPDKESPDSQLAYSYCNLPYQCALPKCTKDYLLGEVPLDLSSANESTKEKTDKTVDLMDKKKTESANSLPSDDSDSSGRGMLYQLLKNKTSK